MFIPGLPQRLRDLIWNPASCRDCVKTDPSCRDHSKAMTETQ